MSDNGIVAWYGAVVSTVALGTTVFSLWRDRPRVKVEGRIGWGVRNVPGLDPAKRYIVITVVNQGRRPCTIQMAGFTARTPNVKRQQYISGGPIGSTGPIEITEGRSATWCSDQADVNAEDVRDFWAIDMAGRKYRGRKLKRWISTSAEESPSWPR